MMGVLIATALHLRTASSVSEQSSGAISLQELATTLLMNGLMAMCTLQVISISRTANLEAMT
jgi:hypothetical protein